MGDYPYRGSEERLAELKKALNDILIWVCDELAPDWEIAIHMKGGADENGDPGNGDCWIEFTDPDGDDVDIGDPEQENPWGMVDYSRNHGTEESNVDD